MDLSEIGTAIMWSLVILLGVMVFRMGTSKGWYFNIEIKNNKSIVIPKELIEYEKRFGSDEYINSLIKKSAYAITWFFTTWLITIMVVVGGSTIVDANPMFRLPCLILIILMQMIMLSKPVFIVAEVIEDFGICGLLSHTIADIRKTEPMRIRESKFGRVNSFKRRGGLK